MKYLKEFNTHASYEDKINIGGSDLEIPIVSYCDDVSDVHYNPYNTVEFYVGDITAITPPTVKIYTDSSTSVDVTVSEVNKWYSYLLPKNKGLCAITGVGQTWWNDDIIKKVIVKANISYYHTNSPAYSFVSAIPSSIIEASFKGSNTSKVTDMSLMFSDCSGLTFLDVSSFDTSNVTNMGNMFYGCRSLTSLNLSNFDTTNVTDMHSMFANCGGLTSLDLRNFNTSKVTDMNSMFQFCSGLTSLDLSKWDTSNVTDMNSMFNGCSKLTTIRMVGCGQTTIDKIKAQLTKDNITGVTINP